VNVIRNCDRIGASFQGTSRSYIASSEPDTHSGGRTVMAKATKRTAAEIRAVIDD
jgi:hypothetical protein